MSQEHTLLPSTADNQKKEAIMTITDAQVELIHYTASLYGHALDRDPNHEMHRARWTYEQISAKDPGITEHDVYTALGVEHT